MAKFCRRPLWMTAKERLILTHVNVALMISRDLNFYEFVLKGPSSKDVSQNLGFRPNFQNHPLPDVRIYQLLFFSDYYFYTFLVLHIKTKFIAQF